jgi:hypothetical protein
MILEKHQETLQKRTFDPTKQEDMNLFKLFLETGRWGDKGCPFILEWPFLTIPDMLKDSITKHVLGIAK